MPIQKISRFEIVRELGKGAMGVVYEAVDPRIGRKIALKTIRFDAADDMGGLDELQKRFVREAQSAGILSHPNIVTIYDVGEDQGLTYIAMEYIEGASLEKLIASNRAVRLDQAIALVGQIAEGLDYAHRKGIVHRDIKPANILIDSEGRPRIVDFGIARLPASSLTRTSRAMGTPHYMAPEQIAGRTVDSRADIFSLGVVLYELLTREKPFPGDDITTIIYRIMNEDPPPPRAFNASLPAGLDFVVGKTLAKDPAARYQTCREFLIDLMNMPDASGQDLGEAMECGDPPADVPAVEFPPPEAGAAVRSRRPVLLLLGAGMVLLGAAVIIALVSAKGGSSAGGSGGPSSSRWTPPVTNPTGPPTVDPDAAKAGKTSDPTVLMKRSAAVEMTDAVFAADKAAAVRPSNPPVILKQVPPEYPEIARQAQVEGVVSIEVIIDINGKVKSARILRSVPLLDEAALKAVVQMEFEPVMVQGSPRDAYFVLNLNFTLKTP